MKIILDKLFLSYTFSTLVLYFLSFLLKCAFKGKVCFTYQKKIRVVKINKVKYIEENSLNKLKGSLTTKSNTSKNTLY